MANFFWLTDEGLIITAQGGNYISSEIATNLTSRVSFSIIAGSIPEGCQLTSNGTTAVISGFSTQNLYDIESKFVIRATSLDFKLSIDRSFSINIIGAAGPIWSTSTIYLKGSNLDKTFSNFEYVNQRFSATIAPSVLPPYYGITYSLNTNSDKLPNKISLGSTGTLSGLINVPLINLNTASTTYNFGVVASNGYSSSNVNVVMTVTFSKSLNQGAVFLKEPNLGKYIAESYQIIQAAALDLRPTYSPITYNLSRGNLPPNLNLDTRSGYIYGIISTQTDYLKIYDFNITASKYNVYSLSTSYTTQTYQMTVIQNNFDSISFITTSNLTPIHISTPSNLKIVATHTETGSTLSYFSIGGNFPEGLTLNRSGNITGIPVSTGTYGVTVLANTGTVAYTSSTWNSQVQSKSYPVAYAVKSFNITVVDSPLKYTNIYARPFLSVAQRLDYEQFFKNTSVFDPEYIYRPEDPNFGVQKEFKMYIQYGIQQLKSVANYQSAFLTNPLTDKQKKFYVQNINVKSIKDEHGIELYDVVYLSINDSLQGTTILNNIRIRFLTLLNSNIKINSEFLPDWQKFDFIFGVVLCYTTPGKGINIANNLKSYLKTLGSFDLFKLDFFIDRFIVEQTTDSTTPSYLLLP